jgi:hypothetical protein
LDSLFVVFQIKKATHLWLCCQKALIKSVDCFDFVIKTI